MSDRPARGWTVYTEEEPATVLEDIRRAGLGELYDRVVEFSIDLSVTVGTAVDAGVQLPGSPMDEAAVAFSSSIPGTPVLIEYLIDRPQREIRITTLLWIR